MTENPKPFLTRGMMLALAFAFVGAAVIAFVFVPLLSPESDTVNAFLVALGFMLIVMAAGHLARSRD